MKLAAVYNVWDGTELLLGSIQQIRSQVEVVIIVYQKLSNRGNSNPALFIDLKKIQELNIVDHFQEFKIDFRPGHLLSAETDKRNLGLEIARQYGCTHFLHIDCDEYYHIEQFKAAREMLAESGIKNSFCNLATYFLKPTWRLSPDETYLVPFIQKLTKENTGPHNKWDKFVVDPSRKPAVIPPYIIFNTDQLLMHHFSWVRADLEMKLRNSSANDVPGFRSQVDELVEKCEAFKSFPGTSPTPWYANHRVTEVENFFNINIQ